ncbi:MAG: DNA translocase FtsK 4TM domain-containing protein [Hyphomicrobiaceae bacterium]|nr:DNA translocase FtsK 4TM domain-containing protein [Hyphomicrobiaceae bacterium]
MRMVFRGSKHGTGLGRPAAQDQPILPPALANSLIETTRATFGYALLAAIALSWAALLTWSATDPSFTRIGVDKARNVLGAPGAHAADAAIQSLGLAAFVLLLAPMFWAVAMIKAEPVRGRILPVIAYLAGIAGFATAAALCRTLPGWPLTHGLGGIGGDHLLSVLVQPLASHLGDLARPVVASIAAASGLLATLFACGVRLPRQRRNRAVGIHQSSLALDRAPPSLGSTDTMRWGPDPLEPARTQTADRRDWHSNTYGLGPGPDNGHGHDTMMPAAQHSVGDYGWTGVGPDLDFSSSPDDGATSTPPPRRGMSGAQDSLRFGPYAARMDEPIESAGPGDRVEFDAWTDVSSSGMAARFAPSANAPRALQSTLSSAFGFASAGATPAERDAHQARDAVTSSWRRPSLNLLARPISPRPVSAYGHALNRGNGRLIADALAEFGIDGTLRDVEPGPVITTFLFEIARTTKLTRIMALAGDIARHLGVPALRVSQRRGLVAIEFPNPDRMPIVLRDCLDSETFRSELDSLPISLGLGTTGAPVIADLAQLSGILVSGGEASSKVTGLNAMILSLMYRHGPEDCRFLLIDPRMVDLAVYDGVPHLLTPVVADPHKAITALAWCVREMEERMKRMSFLGVRNIELFNNRVRNAKKRGEILQRTVQTGFDERSGKARFEKQDIDLAPMPYIIVVIEELADLMAVAGREIEGSVARLAKAARAVGIHLIVATDRPTPDIVTTPIRESLPARLSYRATGRGDSRSVIGDDGAEHLLAGGDSLFSNAGGPAVRVHGPNVTAEETAAIAIHLKERGAPTYVAELAHPTVATHDTQNYRPAATAPSNPADDLYDRAVAIAVRDGGANISHLQSALKVSAGWAASLLARLEAEAVVGPADARGIHRLRPPGTRVA